MKMTFVICVLTILCGCSQPTTPLATSTPVAVAIETPANQDMAALKGSAVKDLTVAPFGGMSKDLDTLLKGKTESSGGAFVPVMDVKKPETFMMVFIGGATAEQLDSRPVQQLVVSGTLKPIEDDATVKAVEAKMSGKWLQHEGKHVYLVAEGDPWPAAPATPTPRVTP
ncbi:hypothetical protein IV102_24460 [bacterium]|nr:hypothetical protein [bacterium]